MKMLRKMWSIVLFFWASVAVGQDVTQLATALADHPDIPGATVGWVTADAMAWEVAGVRVSGRSDAVARDDLWHIGSLAKSMTATVAARLVAAGEMTWDTAARPGGPSLEALLAHVSGLAPMPPDRVFRNLNRDWTGPHEAERRDLSEQALRRWIGPAGAFEYSNLGYVVAGHMLAAWRETPWEALIQDALFAPLGMRRAGFGAPGRTGSPAPWGHDSAGVPVDPMGAAADNPPALAPAGTLHLRVRTH